MLAQEVRLARESGVPLLMLHEMDEAKAACDFDRFFAVTPEDIVKDGVYRSLAIPWFADSHRPVSCALAAQALGATKTAPTRPQRFRLRARAGKSLFAKDTKDAQVAPMESGQEEP